MMVTQNMPFRFSYVAADADELMPSRFASFADIFTLRL